MSNDTKGLINGLESEDIHMFYVIGQPCTKLAMALVIFLSVLVVRVIKVFLMIYTQNKITVVYTVKHLNVSNF